MRIPDVVELLRKQGFDVVADSASDFQHWIRAEEAKWVRVIRASGASAD
jgi:hypothetical protein